MVRPVLQNLPLPFSRSSRHKGLERSSSHLGREDNELLSSTGHTVSSVKSFASSSTVDSRTKAESRQSRPNVFVGRTKHIERLVSEMKSDSTRLVVIHGLEGCGKTWLLEEYRQVHDDDSSRTTTSLVLHSRFAKACEYDDPLAPIWQALLPVLEQREDLVEEFSPLLGCFLPHLYSEANILASDEGNTQTESVSHAVDNWDRERLLAFLLRLFRRLSDAQHTERDEKPRGLVWCLDDLHDASSEVLHLLQTILLGVRGIRFLASCRPVTDNSSALARWLVHLKRHKLESTAMVMRPLNNLSLMNIIQLLERQYILQTPTSSETVKPTSEKFVRALAKQIENFTAGHALAVSQLLRLVNDLGCFKQNELHELPYTTIERISKLPIDPASCLHQVVRLRIRALPDPVQRILLVASAYSSHLFSVETLFCLCQSLQLSHVQDKAKLLLLVSTPADLRDLLDYAACVGFLALHEPDGVYEFVHPLVRDIVMRTLSDGNPPRLHYQLGLVFRDVLLRSASFDLDGVPLSPSGTPFSHTLDSRGVSHWNRLLTNQTDASCLTDRDKADLAAWNRRIALRAQQRQSWLVSAKHFATAVSLLEQIPESHLPGSGSIRQKVWLDWTCERIPVELACGHHEVAQNLAIQVRRTLTASPTYISIARSAIIASHHRQFIHGLPCEPSNDKAIEGCLKWLKELGDGLPELLNACSGSPSKCIERLLTGTKALISKFDFKEWYRPSLSKNQEIQNRMKALECLAHVSAIASPGHYTMAMLRGLQLSIQHGRFAMTPLCFVVLSDVLVRHNKWGSARHYAEMGLKMAQERLDVEMDTRALVMHAQLAAMWGEQGEDDDDAASEGFDALHRHAEVLLWAGSWTYATFSKLAWFWFHFSTCSLTWLSREAREFLQVLTDARQEKLCALFAPCLELLDTLMDASPGETVEDLKGSSGRDAQRQPYHPQFRRITYACRMVAAFWQNDAAQAEAWLSLLTADNDHGASEAPWCPEMRSATDHPTLVFLHGMVAWSLVGEQGLGRPGSTRAASEHADDNMGGLVKLSSLGESYARQLETWASVQARYAGGGGSDRSPSCAPAGALLALLRCQDGASRPEFVNVFSVLKQFDAALAEMERSGVGNGLLAVSYEQAGRYARRQGIPTAPRYLKKSLALYRAWGATLKVRQLEAQLRDATLVQC